MWKERVGDVSLEQLYHEPIVPLAQKVRDLKEMALTHVPSPQRDIYLNLANSYNGSDTDNQDSQKIPVKRQADTETQWNTSQVSLFYSFY